MGLFRVSWIKEYQPPIITKSIYIKSPVLDSFYYSGETLYTTSQDEPNDKYRIVVVERTTSIRRYKLMKKVDGVLVVPITYMNNGEIFNETPTYTENNLNDSEYTITMNEIE